MSLLKERVKEKGITQTKLAEIGNVSNTHISYILEGKRQISYSLAKKIYKELGYYSPLDLILAYYNLRSSTDFTKIDNEMLEILSKIITRKFKDKNLSQDKQMIFVSKINKVANKLY